MSTFRIAEISIYPIKSTAGVCLEASSIQPRGLEHDRRWAIVDMQNDVLTARKFPQLLGITATPASNHLVLHKENSASIRLPLAPVSPGLTEVQVFGEKATGVFVDAEVDIWLSDYLGTQCRLVYMNEKSHRTLLPEFGGKSGDVVSYADECPLLLISEASLADLNMRLDEPVSMRNFRPNLVANGCGPYEEDKWSRIRIGESEFDVCQMCKRCVFTTIDPVTHQKHKTQEPLRTLATYRTHPDGGVAFGVHLIPRGDGVVQTGQEIEVLS